MLAFGAPVRIELTSKIGTPNMIQRRDNYARCEAPIAKECAKLHNRSLRCRIVLVLDAFHGSSCTLEHQMFDANAFLGFPGLCR